MWLEEKKEAALIDRLEIKLLLADMFEVHNMDYINFDKIFYITPSREEVEDLLNDDRTDSVRCDKEYYRCGEFARKLHCATFGKGWACATLKIQAETDNHAHFILIFILDDRSVYLVEPQTDAPYNKEFKILRGDFA